MKTFRLFFVIFCAILSSLTATYYIYSAYQIHIMERNMFVQLQALDKALGGIQ